GAAKLAEAEAHPAYAEWEAKLAGQRLICPQWPEEFGGQGMDAVRGAVLNEEFYRAGVPRVTRGMGEWLVGPSVMVHGTPEQRAFFLPRIISGEDVYCQGFSAPGHGSDLAGVQTRGVAEGDELVITGQKVWTSGAGRANRVYLLCSPAPDAPPLAPRFGVQTGVPLVREELAWAYTRGELMRFSGLRTLAQVAAGRPPGPEASVAKLFWSEYHKRLGEIAMTIEGADGLLRPDGDGYPVSAW